MSGSRWWGVCRSAVARGQWAANSPFKFCQEDSRVSVGNIYSEWTPKNLVAVGAFPNSRARALGFLKSE